jgi:endonuclease/exonuclease/phosphatase family metal-dependent hydrolase
MRGTTKFVLACAGAWAVAAGSQAAEVEVLTQNQYVGTDLIALVTEPDFNAAVVDALKTRAGTKPAERMQALARLIDVRGPALVGLQEVYDFRCADAVPRPHRGCDNPEVAGAFIDQLAATVSALGSRYREVGTVVNLDLPATLPPPLNQLPGVPIVYDEGVIYVSVVDRDVILARDDVEATPVPFAALGFCTASDDGCNFQAAASAPLNVPPFPIPIDIRFERGFVAVDAVVDGRSLRFVNTHLETRLEGSGPAARGFQSAQAFELTQVLVAAAQYLPVDTQVVVGDFNSAPEDPTFPVPPGFPAYLGIPPYLQIANAGFLDAWTAQPASDTARGRAFDGRSCCQWEDLTNRRSDLYERIDLIWTSGAPQVRDARLLGESIGDKTLPKGQGLWPSDHASVAATLRY